MKESVGPLILSDRITAYRASPILVSLSIADLESLLSRHGTFLAAVGHSIDFDFGIRLPFGTIAQATIDDMSHRVAKLDCV